MSIACANEIAVPSPESPTARLRLVPDSVILNPDESSQLASFTFDSLGAVVRARGLSWSISDSSVAAVDTTGMVTALAPGWAVVTASSGVASASAAVEVVLDFVSVAAGAGFTCGLIVTGAAYCWGALENFGSSLTPARVPGSVRFREITTGYSHVCGLTAGGSAHCWGEGGRLGDGSTSGSASPVLVAGGLTFEGISAGTDYTCAVAAGGAAYCWGRNLWGALGTGLTAEVLGPTAVDGGLSFASVEAGNSFTCGLTRDTGDLYCWGRNHYGQLGRIATDGSPHPRPERATAVPELRSVTIGDHDFGCGATFDNVAYCWGHNDFGQVGRGTTTRSEPVPAPVAGDLRFESINAGAAGFHACGTTTEGIGVCWGNVGYTGLPSRAPTPLGTDREVAQLSVGLWHSCALFSGGDLRCWGPNFIGELGDGSTEPATSLTSRVAYQRGIRQPLGRAALINRSSR